MSKPLYGRRNNYSLEEVRQIVESYHELRARADTTAAGQRVLVKLIDLDRAMGALPNRMREYVLLHGLMGMDQETAGRILQVSHQAVSKRYREGLELLHYAMNGGIYF